ncbi:MAG: TniQ family protein [Anaerolineales bacterium]|nr:TniQ family protein [Anaerolineales bacterium]
MSDGLRYCPLCLGEAAYYQLTWRFLTLSGCVRHGCRFLDRCGHCGRQPFPVHPVGGRDLPTLSRDLTTVGLIPCQYKSRKPPSNICTTSISAGSRTISLMGPNILSAIGLRFAYWRLERGILVVDAADQVDFQNSPSYDGGTWYWRATFLRYIQYAAYLSDAPPSLPHRLAARDQRVQLASVELVGPLA